MEDRSVLKKIVFSALAGVLAFVTAVFTTVLELSFFWRTVWLSVCLAFFLVTLIGVFILCGDINSEHSQPESTERPSS
jgi:hypothetical protein